MRPVADELQEIKSRLARVADALMPGNAHAWASVLAAQSKIVMATTFVDDETMPERRQDDETRSAVEEQIVAIISRYRDEIKHESDCPAGDNKVILFPCSCGKEEES